VKEKASRQQASRLPNADSLVCLIAVVVFTSFVKGYFLMALQNMLLK
jgi:hypothetical protein